MTEHYILTGYDEDARCRYTTVWPTLKKALAQVSVVEENGWWWEIERRLSDGTYEFIDCGLPNV